MLSRPILIGSLFFFLFLFLVTFTKSILEKKTLYIIRYVSLILLIVTSMFIYKHFSSKEGLSPSDTVTSSVPVSTISTSTANGSVPVSTTTVNGSGSGGNAPSIATFDVNSPASFALLAEGQFLNPPPSAVPIPTNWYQPGSFRVPFLPSDTTDPIFMNQSTNISQVTPVANPSYKQSGFCTEQSNYPVIKESKCNALSNDTCASTECCVLFGGEKCVAGNEQGPLIQTNYSNFLIKNRDYYYYQGKCYGNCDNQ